MFTFEAGRFIKLEEVIASHHVKTKQPECWLYMQYDELRRSAPLFNK